MALKSSYTSEEKGAEIEETLDALDTLIDRVKVLYEQYFMGIQKQPPTHLHTTLERELRELQQQQIRNTALRYRLATLQQKHGAYNTYWKRTLREIEGGRYLRNLSRLRAKAAKTGEEIPEEILAKMPKRMRDAIAKDRELALAKAEREQRLSEEVRAAVAVEQSTEERKRLRRESTPALVVSAAPLLDEHGAHGAHGAGHAPHAGHGSGAHHLPGATAPAPSHPPPSPARPPLGERLLLDDMFGDDDIDAALAALADEAAVEIERRRPNPPTPTARSRPAATLPPPVASREPAAPSRSAPPPLPPPRPTPPAARPAAAPPAAATASAPPAAATASAPPAAATASAPPAAGPPSPPSPPRVVPPIKIVPPGFPGSRPASPPASVPVRAATPPVGVPVRAATPPAGVPAIPPVPHPIAPLGGAPPPTTSNGAQAAATPPAAPAAPEPPPAPAPSAPIAAAVEVSAPAAIADGREAVPSALAMPASGLTIVPQASAPHAAPPSPSSGVRPAVAKPTLSRPAGARPEPPSNIPGMSDAETRALYAKYVKARTLVGDRTEPMSYERMVKTLSAQAPKIMSEHHTGGVEFNVVVRDNKVILKAKPK